MSAGTASCMDIVTKGRPHAVIVLGEDAIPAERTAANELHTHIRQMAGAQLLIIASAHPAPGCCCVFIGQTAATRALLPGFKWNSLVHDGILIKRVGPDLVIAGDRPRGTLYAVYDYLESLGVRFLAPDATLVPVRPTIPLPQSGKQYVPKVYYRELTYQRVLRKNPAFCARMRLNGTLNAVPVEYGGGYSLIGWCHTFDYYLPASRYFQAHPEWYSEIGGRRIGGPRIGQLCLTNAGMKQEFIRRVLEEISHDPAAGLADVSQNDGAGPCTCPKCTAGVKRLGNQSDLLLSFVNDIAAAVEKRYPDFKVETLAYSYTRTPPQTVRPRHNVIIRLCTGGDYSQPFSASVNKPFRDDIEAWRKLTDKLFLWDYTVGFANLHLPYPNTQVLAPNIRLFVANGVTGLHEQGDLYNTEVSMQPLKTYMLAKLMWDPSLDETKLQREFLNNYYGPAGRYLYSYLQMLEKAVREHPYTLGGSPTSVPCLTPGYLAEAFSLFEKAERSVAGNPVLLNRVRQQKLSLQQAWVRSPLESRDSARTVTGIDDARLADGYQKLAEATGNVFISEGVHINWDEFRFAAAGDTVPDTNPLPERAKGLPANAWKEMRLSRATLAAPDVAGFVDDAQAVSGKAIRVSGASYDWAVQLTISPFDLRNFTRAEVIVSVKCTGRGTDPKGKAFETGVYDIQNRETVPPRIFSLGDIHDDGYHEYSAGVHDLKDGMFIYFAPPGNEKLIDAMYIDRIYLVKSAAR